jgi:hypothetical protein
MSLPPIGSFSFNGLGSALFPAAEGDIAYPVFS